MIIRLLCYGILFIAGFYLVPSIHNSGIYPPFALLALAGGVTLIGALLDVIIRTVILHGEAY